MEGIGMMGFEDTFMVAPSRRRCITGSNPGLMLVE